MLALKYIGQFKEIQPPNLRTTQYIPGTLQTFRFLVVHLLRPMQHQAC